MRALLVILIFSVAHTSLARIDVSTAREEAQATEIRQSFESALDLHRQKKVGVGLAFAGVAGTMAANIQMNFALDVGVAIGYGFGSGFTSFTANMKQLLGTGGFAPYYGLGYAKWTGNGKDLSGGSTPSILTDKFLSTDEKRSGEFSENFIYPSIGVQLYKMSGDWAGSSVYLELVYMLDVEDFAGGATGGLGYTRFF